MSSSEITLKGQETCEMKQVEWKIENFTSLPTNVGKFYQNDYFSFANKEWCLKIFPGGDREQPQQYISLFLRTGRQFHSECNISYTLSIKKADGYLEQCLTEINHTFNQAEYDYGFCKFFSRSELLKRKTEFLPSGVLTIVCTLTKGLLLKATPPPHALKLGSTEKLSADLQGLLDLKKSCDVTLVVRGKEFQVHKSVLMARSPVFSAMFEHDLSEKETGTVVIPDCDEQTFGQFLEYIYSGKVNKLTFCDALQLYPTAHKYDTEELKLFCLQFMVKNLTAEYVIDAVLLAYQYDEAKFASAFEHFFSRNLKKVFLAKKWETLVKENFPLANRLLISLTKHLDQDDSTESN